MTIDDSFTIASFGRKIALIWIVYIISKIKLKGLTKSWTSQRLQDENVVFEHPTKGGKYNVSHAILPSILLFSEHIPGNGFV